MKLNTTISMIIALVSAPQIALAADPPQQGGELDALEARAADAEQVADLGDLSASGDARATTTTTTTTTRATFAAGNTDHSRVVRSFGVGYMGFSTLQIPSDTDGSLTSVSAPVIGARYWINQRLGLDLGLGFNFGSGTITVGDTDVDDTPAGVYIVHAGVPLALADSEHFVFQVVPEMNMGFSAVTYEGVVDTDVTAFHFDMGARIGAEVHFGFIGLPYLALQAGVGVRFAFDSWDVNVDGEDAASRSGFTMGTTLNGDPWAIFAGNISALYYFGN